MHTFRTARLTDADRCFEIETAAYEGDEAATLEKIRTRIELYPRGFLILETEAGVAGFINSGCADVVEMADDAFKELVGHDADAPNVVILSVVVDPAFQGQVKLYSRHPGLTRQPVVRRLRSCCRSRNRTGLPAFAGAARRR